MFTGGIMKPIKLKMSAFGPYKDIVEIDFEKIGNSRNILNYWRYRQPEKQAFLMPLYLLYMEKQVALIEMQDYLEVILQIMRLKLMQNQNFLIKEKTIK